MDTYVTKTKGVEGKIKVTPEDFIVEEVLVDNSVANVNAVLPNRVLGSTSKKQRYLLCVLIKKHWDTLIAIKNIAKALCIESGRVQFAGIKDAKAVTGQYITLENISIEEAEKISISNVKIVPVGYVRDVLSIFYLLGNNFTITLKDLSVDEETVKETVEETVQELNTLGGMPNFFGHQRFGTTRPITHLVGKSLLQGKFEEAAMLFLANPSDFEHPTSRQARQELQSTKNFNQALNYFPRQLRFERMMLNRLAEEPTDFIGAFKQLPLKLQALFVQAYQSYLFNRFLSERLKQGLPLNEGVEGDYVIGIERTGLPIPTVSKIVTKENLDEVNAQIKAGRLRLALPIFSVRQTLSQGTMGQIEREILEQEGIETEKTSFNVLSRVGGKGSLRPVLAPVKNFNLQSFSEAESGSIQAKVNFMLLRGCYATVLLREIMKPKDLVRAGF